MTRRRDGRAKSSNKDKLSKNKKIKPIRRKSWTVRRIFQENDFTYVDKINRKNSSRGRKGYLDSALFSALLLMYLKGMDSLLELVKFLDNHKEWLRFLNLKRMKNGQIQYMVPDRTTFNKLVKRYDVDGITEIFIQMVAQMMKKGIIKPNRLSIDATIISALFKDKNGKKGKLKRSRDKDAGKGFDSYRNIWVYGYKIHIMLDTDTALPIGIIITKANYGENRTVKPFVDLLTQRYGITNIDEVFCDSAYDGNQTRLLFIDKLHATPYIELNPRNCKGDTPEEKRERRKHLCEKFYKKNFIHEYWVDPDSELFDEKFDARTFSEQAFSISKGSLKLDRYRHRGIIWATMHSVLVCMCMLVVANTAIAVKRPDLKRCIKCFNNRIIFNSY